MSTWLFHISETADEAQMMGQGCTFVVVSEDYYNQHHALQSEHILDDIIRDTRIPNLEARIAEEAESFFSSSLSPDDLRSYLVGTGHFREAKLF